MNASMEECNDALNNFMNEMERVNNYCYLGDNMNGERGSELAVTRRIGLGWKAFNSMSSMWQKTHMEYQKINL